LPASVADTNVSFVAEI